MSQKRLVKLGIHTHNDGGVAVANTLEFVNFVNDARFLSYIAQVQGTFGGFGERIGNVDLFQVLGNLDRLGVSTGVDAQRTKLFDAFNEYCEIAEVRPFVNTPYVGGNGGKHKAGVHVDGEIKGASYSFYDLSRVGNYPTPVLSNQSGTANMVLLANTLGYEVKKDDPRIKDMLAEFKQMIDRGYRNGSLPAEQYLLVHKHFSDGRTFFTVSHPKWVIEEGAESLELEGRVNGHSEIIKSQSHRGPVDTVFTAHKKLLDGKYESVDRVELSDFWSRKIDTDHNEGSASYVRVRVEFKYTGRDGKTHYWQTVGVHEDILIACTEAASKGFRYHLLRHQK